MAEPLLLPRRRGVLRAPLRTLGDALRAYVLIARLWMRAIASYRASFWILAVSGFLTTGLDFVAILVFFTRIDTLGGFGLREIAFLYGASGIGLAVGDMFVGRIERLGRMIREGSLDAMLLRPVPLLAQVCADEFTPRRLARVLQAGGVFAWGCGAVDWTPGRAGTTAVMLICSMAIFSGLFVAMASLQFWTSESAEFANAFTYGGNTITQYPLSIFPGEVVKAITFGLPIAFVNWYPALSVLGRPDPFGLPARLQHAAPAAAVAVLVLAGLVWRAGVRHHRSTGS